MVFEMFLLYQGLCHYFHLCFSASQYAFVFMQLADKICDFQEFGKSAW